ncbi:MAG: hypothetical protein AAF790_13045, partial [Planctomycetota bacterium]
FAVTSGADGLIGFIDALQQNNIAKILAEPNIVAVSGRPAQFNEGGEIPILIPQGLGQISVEYKPFGTQVDFLPIVLGNGNIRLEVRPRVSDLDPSNGVTIDNVSVPALTVREVDTAVEMKAGQTFALAGLIQRRTESVNRGLPFLSDVPVIGAPFRRVQEEVNEIELLILVTPEFVDAMEPHEAPHCYPGAGTMSPDNHELYWGGHIEVPNRCNGCNPCECVPTHGHEPCCPGGGLGVDHSAGGYCGSGYDDAMMQPAGPEGFVPTPLQFPPHGGPAPSPAPNGAPVEMTPLPLPTGPAGGQNVPAALSSGPAAGMLPSPAAGLPRGAGVPGRTVGAPLPPGARAAQAARGPAAANAGAPSNGAPQGPAMGQYPRPAATRNYTAARQPNYRRGPTKPYNPPRAADRPAGPDGLIGPVGYDPE